MLRSFQEMCHSSYWNIAKKWCYAALSNLFKKNSILFQEGTETIQEDSFRKYCCTYSILRQVKAYGQNLEKKRPCSGTTSFQTFQPSSSFGFTLLFTGWMETIAHSTFGHHNVAVDLPALPYLGGVGSLGGGSKRSKFNPRQSPLCDCLRARSQ